MKAETELEEVTLRMRQGSTWRRWIWLRSRNRPVSLAGAKARMHVRYEYDSPLPFLRITTDNGRASINVAEGRIELTVQADVTAGLPGNIAAPFDLEVEFASGEVWTVVSGVLEIDQEVTR